MSNKSRPTLEKKSFSSRLLEKFGVKKKNELNEINEIKENDSTLLSKAQTNLQFNKRKNSDPPQQQQLQQLQSQSQSHQMNRKVSDPPLNSNNINMTSNTRTNSNSNMNMSNHNINDNNNSNMNVNKMKEISQNKDVMSIMSVDKSKNNNNNNNNYKNQLPPPTSSISTTTSTSRRHTIDNPAPVNSIKDFRNDYDNYDNNRNNNNNNLDFLKQPTKKEQPKVQHHKSFSGSSISSFTPGSDDDQSSGPAPIKNAVQLENHTISNSF